MKKTKLELVKKPKAEPKVKELKPKCGLCNSSKKKLTKTPCCDNWICDDTEDYQLFSYARNSCYRNHDRYTLCSSHYHEKHKGIWQNCKECKSSFALPDHVEMGTNDYNFERLENPEEYTITCVNCGFSSHSMNDFPFQTSKGYYCDKKKCQGMVFKF